MKNPILKIVSLSKTYNRDVVALSDFNLYLNSGAILGLLGPNGSGKSTLVNILANIVKRDSGEIYMFDRQINENSFYYKSACGFVLEKPVYIEKLSILEYLEFAGRMYKLPQEQFEQRLHELIDIFDLGSKKDLWIENCSKGMKKKISIATALLHNPQLIILDEPFSDLDLIALGQLKEIMKKVKKSGKTILIASHNIQELENVCDDFAMIKEGKVLFQKNFEAIHKDIDKFNLENFENFVYKYIDKGYHKTLPEIAPDIKTMMDKMMVGLDRLNRTAAWAKENEVQDFTEAAIWYLKEYESTWKNWVTGDAYNKIKDALKAEM